LSAGFFRRPYFEQMFQEKRKNLRRAMRFNAWIGTDDKQPLRGCMVSDISDDGARLDVESADELPDEFQLLLSGGGIYQQCRAVWRTNTQIGVEFKRRTAPRAKAPRPTGV
jgi:hypothetical protein